MNAAHDEPVVPFEVAQAVSEALGASEVKSRLQKGGAALFEAGAHYLMRRMKE